MESKLRKKFIYFSVGIIAIVLLSIMAFVNVTNFYNLKRSSDELLKTLVENNGVMPSFKLNNSHTDVHNLKISIDVAHVLSSSLQNLVFHHCTLPKLNDMVGLHIQMCLDLFGLSISRKIH